METDKQPNYKVLGQEFVDELRSALERELSWENARDVLEVLEDKLSIEQLGRVASELAYFYTSGEAQWAVETPMPDRDAAQLLSKALGVRIPSTSACKTGWCGHTSQAWTAPEFAEGCTIHATRHIEDQTHFHLEFEGWHIGMSVHRTSRGYDVLAMLYGQGEGAKLAASYWVKGSKRMASYLPTKFYGD